MEYLGTFKIKLNDGTTATLKMFGSSRITKRTQRTMPQIGIKLGNEKIHWEDGLAQIGWWISPFLQWADGKISKEEIEKYYSTLIYGTWSLGWWPLFSEWCKSFIKPEVKIDPDEGRGGWTMTISINTLAVTVFHVSRWLQDAENELRFYTICSSGHGIFVAMTQSFFFEAIRKFEEQEKLGQMTYINNN